MNKGQSLSSETTATAVDRWIHNIDWGKTTFGPKNKWSASFKNTINLCLHSKQPTMVLWGIDAIVVYNQAFQAIANLQPSSTFGQSLQNVSKQIWNSIQPLINKVNATKEAQLSANIAIPLAKGTRQEYLVTIALTPVINDADIVEGIFATITETISSVNRDQILRELRNKQLESLFIQAPIALCILKGSDFVVEIANEKILEIWGKTADQVMDKPIFDSLPEAGNQGYQELLSKVYKHGERVIYDELKLSVFRGRQPEDVYIKFAYEPLVEADGVITGVMVLADDITEQVINRKKVEESEERLRLAIESTHVGTWDYRPGTGELNWSEECKKIYAIPPGQHIDFDTFSAHIHPSDKDFVQHEIAKSMISSGPGTYDITFRILRFGDDAIRWITAKGRVFFNADGAPERFVGTVMDITEQKTLEETLKESELRTRLAIEASELGAFDWDIKTSDFQYSERLAQIFGYTDTKDLQQNDFSDRIHPDDRERRLQAHERAFKEGTLFYEVRVVWPDQSVHWVRLNGKVVYDDAGLPSRMYGTTSDITTQRAYSEKLEREIAKRTNRLHERNLALKQSEERYHRMVEEVQDYAIILLDRDGYIQNWNLGAEKIKQYTDEEIIGKHFSIFYLPEDLHNNLPHYLINEASLHGRSAQEGWRKRKDGSKFWGSVTITALHNEQNDVIGFSKVTRDLTDKKIAEEELKISNEELKMSEERYHQMIAEIQDYAIILLDTHGNIQNWNTGAEFIKGYHSTEILGRNFEVFYTEHDRVGGLPSRLLSEAEKRGRSHHEGWRVRKDGTKFWGNIVITALHNKKGNLIGFSKVTRDLTEKKSAEDKLLRYAAELESQNKELEQFAYIASHDLQEPLRKIQTFAELIQDNLKDEQIVKRYFDKIQDSAKRMAELIKSVLNFSKLSQIEAEAVDVDLNETVANILADFELLISERHAIITVDHLPTIKGVSLHLSQLFANLISNGIKFSQTEPRISVRCNTVTKSQVIHAPDFLEDIAYYEISISDNGIGFDQQYEKLIFQMFKRLHAKQHYAGTGIGLALCKKIVENHHGYIAAQGELGKGSTFYVYLPKP